MTSVTQLNSAEQILSSSKHFLEDGAKFNGQTIEKMSNAIKNSENLDEFLGQINRQNDSQCNSEPATAAGSPQKTGTMSARTPSKVFYNMSLYDPFQYLNSSDEEECTFHPRINEKSVKLCKRPYTGDTNEQLYRHHAERTLKKQESTEVDAQNFTQRTTLNLSDKKSIKMIIQKLQNAINKLVAECEDEDGEKLLTFEGLGTVLHRLGVFQNLEFSNSSKDGERSSLTINYARVKPERLAKEVAFHENFWRVISVPTLITDKVSCELVAKILTVLVEEKTAVVDAGNFLTDVINAALADVGLKGDGEKTAFELQQEEKKLWSLQKVVSEFRQLFDNKTNFMAIYNTKTVLNTEELGNKFYNQPHAPTTTKKSAKLDKKKWQPKFNSRLEKHVPTLSQKDLKTRNTKLYNYNKYLQDSKSARLEARIAEELNPCTFFPKTTKYKKPVYNNRSEQNDSLSPSRLGYFSQALAEPSVANRHLLLYEVAKTYKEKLQQKSYAYKMKEESTEMAECSFKPKLNRYYETSPVRQQDFYEGVARGFKKNVERLHLGAYLKETRTAELERIPRGENYERNKEAEFNPPTFLQRPKITKDEVLVYVDVSIGPGKTGRIGIHRGDNAKALAKNFARTYSLNANMNESLEKLLQTYIDSYFAQPAPQQPAVEEGQQYETEEVEEEQEEEEEEEDN